MSKVLDFEPRRHEKGPEPVPMSVRIAGAALLLLVVLIMSDFWSRWSKGPDLPPPPSGHEWRSAIDRGYWPEEPDFYTH